MLTHEQCMAWLRAFAALINDNTDFLTDLDAAIGDADHGTNMARGATAAPGKLDSAAPPGAPSHPDIETFRLPRPRKATGGHQSRRPAMIISPVSGAI